jgi:hypothetical protein
MSNIDDLRLATVETSWSDKIKERQALLAQVQNELVELENLLADRLAEINAFEFAIRSRLRPMIRRLDSLEEEVDELRRSLRREAPADPEGEWADWAVDDSGPASTGEYRYWDRSVRSRPTQPADVDRQELKQLYRELARRFHPDMALDAEDRAYRTGLMMAINAAYAAGDLGRLREIALEPDGSQRVRNAKSDEQLAEALQLEIDRCMRRITEIKIELEAAKAHQSSRLMRRVEQAAAKGKDLLADIERQMRDEISHKMVERDVLRTELEAISGAGEEPSREEIAYVVWDTTLDDALDDVPDERFTEQLRRRQRSHISDDDILDDSD